MKHLKLIIFVFIIAFSRQAYAQYYSVNFDVKTVAAMVAAYGTGTVAEAYYDEQVQDILKHYKASELAAAGIFASKFLERKALTDLGLWSSSTENYYYRRIYHLVAYKIIPKIWIVAKEMLYSPQTAIHWQNRYACSLKVLSPTVLFHFLILPFWKSMKKYHPYLNSAR